MNRTARWTLGALLVLLGSAGAAHAQQAGDRVRVAVDGGARITGRLERMGTDTLVMMGRDSVLRTIPLETVQRLDVARGRGSRVRGTLRGAAIGMGVGIAAGAVVGALAYEDECEGPEPGFCLDFGRGFDAYLGGFMGGVAGTLVGGTAGAVRDPTRWVSIPGQPRVKLGARRDGGIALGTAIPLR
jgi:hypothetical protein